MAKNKMKKGKSGATHKTAGRTSPGTIGSSSAASLARAIHPKYPIKTAQKWYRGTDG